MNPMTRLNALLHATGCLLFVVPALFVVMMTQAGPAMATSPAFVRVVHAAPGIGTADVFLDGTQILSNFQFGTVTNYASIPPGPHKVQISLIGKGIGAATLTQTLNVAPETAYTVAALGTAQTGFSLEAFVDNNQLNAGMTKFRFYHLSPGTGTVNILNGNQTLIQGLTYQQASSYVAVQPGSYTFTVDASQPTTSLPITTTLKANTVTSEFAVGQINGTPKIEIVSSQVSGLPGLPGTGSDPNPADITGTHSPSLPFMNILIILAVSGIAVAMLRFTRSRSKRHTTL